MCRTVQKQTTCLPLTLPATLSLCGSSLSLLLFAVLPPLRFCVFACFSAHMQPQKKRTHTLRIANCRCPLCRKAFSLSDLIRIVKPKEGGCGGGAGPSAGGAGAGAGSSSKGKEAADPVLDEPRQQQKRLGQVAWCEAATEVCLSRLSFMLSCIICTHSAASARGVWFCLETHANTRKHSNTYTLTQTHTQTHTHTYSPTLTRKWP